MTSYFVEIMRRRLPALAIAGVLLVVGTADVSTAYAASRLITEEEARHLGLERAWFVKVRLDSARNGLDRAVLRSDRLTVLTTAGVVQELDALTGKTLWTAPIGNSDHPNLGPAAGDDHIALLNGSTLYVLDRTDGRPVMVRLVGGAPGAAPALSNEYVFVPLLGGRVEGYPLPTRKPPPADSGSDIPKVPVRPESKPAEKSISTWYYQSMGRVVVPPLATPRSFVWATDTGHLYVARLIPLRPPLMWFRLESHSEIIAPPAYRDPLVYVATVSGDVFALHEVNAVRLPKDEKEPRPWKYSTGFPVARVPAAVAERVYVTSSEPALHSIEALSGSGVWEAPNITQFAAASRNRVYAVDERARLVVLDAANGAILARLPIDIASSALVNDQTDRVYLIANDGVIQCLHELGAEQPLYHQPKPVPAEPADSAEGEPAEPGASTEPQEPADDSETPPAEEAEEAEMPTEESEVGDDDPFGEFAE